MTRYDGLTLSMTGLSETEARKFGFDVISSTMTKKDKAGYMPSAENITIKLIADRRTKKSSVPNPSEAATQIKG